MYTVGRCDFLFLVLLTLVFSVMPGKELHICLYVLMLTRVGQIRDTDFN